MCSRFETNPIFAIIHSKSELRSLSECKGDVDSYIKQYHAVCIYIILISVIFLKKETDIERKSVIQAQSKTKMETASCVRVSLASSVSWVSSVKVTVLTHTPCPFPSCHASAHSRPRCRFPRSGVRRITGLAKLPPLGETLFVAVPPPPVVLGANIHSKSGDLNLCLLSKCMLLAATRHVIPFACQQWRRPPQTGRFRVPGPCRAGPDGGRAVTESQPSAT